MKKKLLIAIIIVALLGAGVACFFYFKNKSQNGESEMTLEEYKKSIVSDRTDENINNPTIDGSKFEAVKNIEVADSASGLLASKGIDVTKLSYKGTYAVTDYPYYTGACFFLNHEIDTEMGHAYLVKIANYLRSIADDNKLIVHGQDTELTNEELLNSFSSFRADYLHNGEKVDAYVTIGKLTYKEELQPAIAIRFSYSFNPETRKQN